MNYYCYLILVQGLVENHFFGSPELLTDYKQLLLDKVSVISRILKAKLKAEADNPYRDLECSGYHKNRI